MIGAWISIGLTLAVFSMLLEDNPLSRLAESVYVGASVGYGLSVLLFDLLLPRWQEGSLLLPGILAVGILIPFLRRWALAVMAGYAAGVTLPRIVETHILKQIEGATMGLVLVGTLATLWRFRQTGESRGLSKGFSRLGGMFLMVYLGASFGNAAQGRLALLQGRFSELAANGYATAVLGGVALLVLWRTKKPSAS